MYVTLTVTACASSSHRVWAWPTSFGSRRCSASCAWVWSGSSSRSMASARWRLWLCWASSKRGSRRRWDRTGVLEHGGSGVRGPFAKHHYLSESFAAEAVTEKIAVQRCSFAQSTPQNVFSTSPLWRHKRVWQVGKEQFHGILSALTEAGELHLKIKCSSTNWSTILHQKILFSPQDIN